MRQFVLPFLLAAATGTLSGWGVGGGTLLTVCMTLLFGIEHREAQAINLLFFLPTAALSLRFHRKNSLIDRAAWVQTAVPGTILAVICAAASLMLKVSLLRRPFGIFLIICGISMLHAARRP